MTDAAAQFHTVILCEDIRDEVGNKKSLMGVITGDLVVSEFPATLPVAIFMVYSPNADRDIQLSFYFRLMQNDNEVVKASLGALIPAGQSVNLILPKALMSVEKEVVFRLLVSVNQGPEEEIMRKRIFSTEPTTSSTEPAPPA